MRAPLAPPAPPAAFFSELLAREGPGALAKGLVPSMLRGSAITVGQMACYDLAKRRLKEAGLREGAQLHAASALVAGAAAAGCAAPFDIIKSRAMAQSEGAASMRAVVRGLAQEGALPRALFRGVLPAYLRQGPHVLICLPIMEQLRSALGLPPV